MATTFKDFHQGTSLTAGYTSLWYDRAVRMFRVTVEDDDGNPLNTEQTLNEAINFIASGSRVFHQSITDLPLQRVRAVRMGPNKVFVALIYARDRWSFPTSDPLTSISIRNGYDTIATFRRAYDDVTEAEKFDIYGLPDGSINVEDPTEASPGPQPIPWKVPVMRLHVRTVLTSNPMITLRLDRFIRTLNTATVNWHGTDITAGKIRFDGAEVDWSEGGTGGGLDFFTVNYWFTMRGNGHVQQQRIYNLKDVDRGGPDLELRLPSLPENEWAVITEQMHPAIWAAGVFPVA